MSKFILSRIKYRGLFITSLWILPIYKAIKPRHINVMPLNNIFTTTIIEIDEKYELFKIKLETKITTVKTALMQVMTRPI